MTSRERTLAALRHEEPDRVPIDFGGHRSSGIAAIAYARLREALGITSGEIRVYDMIQQLAIIEPEVLDALGVDTVELGRGFMHDPAAWQEWVLPDGTPCLIPSYLNVERRGGDWFLLDDDGTDLAVQPHGALYFDQVHWPWLEEEPDQQDFADLEEALAGNMWGAAVTPGADIPLTPDGCRQLAGGARRLRESTDRAIVGIFGGNLFEVPQFLYRNDNYLMHLGQFPEDCERLSEALSNLYLSRLEAWLGAVGPSIDVVLFGDDFGGQNGPLISPAMYRRCFKPWQAKLWGRAKELAPHVKVNLHSCGGLEPLLDDLIDAGLDTLNPVQITCDGMDPRHLKDTYGERLTFWGGGCDTRHTLPHARPDEIRAHVGDLLSIWSPGGGYIFQQVHNIQADVPPENILAMFEAVRRHRPAGKPVPANPCQA